MRSVLAAKHAASAPSTWLSVSGNRILNATGSVVVLRGVSLIDIGALGISGVRTAIDRVNGWGATIVRLPVYPTSVEGYDSPRPWTLATANAYYTDLLRPAVDYCKSKGYRAIVDYHDISDSNGTKNTRCLDFWNDTAHRFSTEPGVVFEAFNEPIDNINNDPEIRWTDYLPRAQGWVNAIRAAAPNNLIFVGAPIWSQNIGPAATRPVSGTNLIYVAHPYPPNWNTWFQDQITSCAAVHPVIFTEWGYDTTTPTFGTTIRAFVEAHGLSWTAWVDDNAWWPPMFNSSWVINTFGTFVRGWLQNP